LGEAGALVLGAVALPASGPSRVWYSRGIATFLDSLRRGLSAGVVWNERASSYHFFALELTALVWAALRAHGQPVPPGLAAYAARLREGAQLLMPTRDSFVRWGDDDDYRLVDPLQDPAHRGAWAIEAVSRMTGEPPPWNISDWDPVLPWVLGPVLRTPLRGTRLHGINSQPEIARWDAGGATLCISGPLAEGHAVPGHAHADLASLSLFSRGTPLIMDPGTFTYGGDPRWRNHFRTTGAHSTVAVDGRSQLDPAARFGWTGTATGAWELLSDAFGLALIAARHNAYRSIGVAHRRILLLSSDATIVLRDELTGRGRHRVSQRFLLPADTGSPGRGDPGSLLVGGRPASLLLQAAAPPDWRVVLGGEEGWWSDAYGRKQPALLASRSLETDLPIVMDVILELGGGEVHPVEGGAVVERPDRVEVLALRLDGSSMDVELPGDAGRFRSDACAAHLVLTRVGRPRQVRFIRGSWVEVGPGSVLQSCKELEGVCMRWDERGLHVASLEPWTHLGVGLEPGRIVPAGSPRASGDCFASVVVSA
jgi:hypothetical protein